MCDPASFIRVFHRAVGTLPVSIPLKKMSYLPPATLTDYRFQRVGAPWASFLSWQGTGEPRLVQVCAGNHVQVISSLWAQGLVPGGQHSTPLSLLLLTLPFFPPFLPRALGGGVGNRCPLYGWVVDSHLVLVLWPFMSLCSHCWPLQNEASRLKLMTVPT